MTDAISVDLTHHVRLPVIKSIDESELPELSPRQTIFTPMCARAGGIVCCDQAELADQGEPSHVDNYLHYFIQPVRARLKAGGVGCANCDMPAFKQP